MDMILAIVAVVLLAWGGYELYQQNAANKNMAIASVVLGLLAGAGGVYCYSECKEKGM